MISDVTLGKPSLKKKNLMKEYRKWSRQGLIWWLTEHYPSNFTHLVMAPEFCLTLGNYLIKYVSKI